MTSPLDVVFFFGKFVGPRNKTNIVCRIFTVFVNLMTSSVSKSLNIKIYINKILPVFFCMGVKLGRSH